eukprot:TRINITY_DN1214_c0_g1_i4.p1 TRINITY_DN1214_c0_g1~~TRINITY_DN1214_c0_g1_i4.p1  ORF type:complete len:147 (+),score=46.68 TRINITY_DN1214_c0_g1_i4:58-498(+)
MSILYSGTPALKTDFTRTGKRTINGSIADGINSVTRYYLNNFCDGDTHDALDLFQGRFIPEIKTPSPFRNRPSRISMLFMRVFFVMVILFSVWWIMAPEEYVPSGGKLVGLFALLYGFLCYRLMLLFGRSFVSKPRFVPDPALDAK